MNPRHDSELELALEVEYLVGQDLSNARIRRIAQLIHRAQFAAFARGIELRRQYPDMPLPELWFTKGKVKAPKHEQGFGYTDS